MSLSRFVAVSALVLPSFVLASNTFNVGSSNCSGALVSSSTDGLSFACTGDFFLSNGVIESDTSILLSATGSLQLMDLSLTSPSITLSAGRFVALDSGTLLKISGNDPLLAPTAFAGSAILRGGGLELRQSQIRDVIQWEGFDISTGSTVHFMQPGTIQLGTVPEPGGAILMMAGLVFIGLAPRKDRKA